MGAATQSLDRGALVVRVAIACIVLPSVCVIVRFCSRAVERKGYFDLDDWLCLISLILQIGLCGIAISWTEHGFGKHLSQVASETPGDIEIGLKLVFASYYLFQISLATVKFSALCFYTRIFQTLSRRFNIALCTAHGLVAAWLIFGIPSITWKCHPVRFAWDKSIPSGHCYNSVAWYIANSAFDCLLDLVVLLLPMPMLWSLQMSRSKKTLVIGAFLCGYCSIVASVGRLVSIAKIRDTLDADFTWNGVDAFIWTFVEPAIGIISICLPSFFYLIKRARTGRLQCTPNSGQEQICKREGFVHRHDNQCDVQYPQPKAFIKDSPAELVKDEEIELEYGLGFNRHGPRT